MFMKLAVCYLKKNHNYTTCNVLLTSTYKEAERGGQYHRSTVQVPVPYSRKCTKNVLYVLQKSISQATLLER